VVRAALERMKVLRASDGQRRSSVPAHPARAPTLRASRRLGLGQFFLARSLERSLARCLELVAGAPACHRVGFGGSRAHEEAELRVFD